MERRADQGSTTSVRMRECVSVSLREWPVFDCHSFFKYNHAPTGGPARVPRKTVQYRQQKYLAKLSNFNICIYSNEVIFNYIFTLLILHNKKLF